MNKKRGIYAFSGDPITYGHIDIIKRAALLFDELIVGIGENPNKKYTFSLEERKSLARNALVDLANVQVISFKGLLVDYAYRNNINYIVRGLRNIRDFDYEAEMAFSNASQKRGIETIPLFSNPRLSHCSSSMVKAIQKEMGNVMDYVPMPVKRALEAKISGQFRLTLTGSIACGKSTITDRLVAFMHKRGYEAYNIDLDLITREIYCSELPRYRNILSHKFKSTFGPQVINNDGSINRVNLAKIVFNDVSGDKFQALDELMREPLETELRQNIYDKKGLIIINAAIAPERDWLYVSNNNVVLIDVDINKQVARLRERNRISEQEARQRIERQKNFVTKKKLIIEKQNEDKFGELIIFDNNEPLNDSQINNLFNSILKIFPDISGKQN